MTAKLTRRERRRLRDHLEFCGRDPDSRRVAAKLLRRETKMKQARNRARKRAWMADRTK